MDSKECRKAPKVVAVVVAYNNPQELDNCLYAIANQSYSVRTIVCVDNSAASFQKTNKEIIDQFENCKIEYFYNDTSPKGSAKGYEIGMRFAISNEPDFVWLNDQDGVPQNDCLERMLDSFYACNNSATKVVVPCLRSQEDKHYMRAFSCDFNPFLHTLGLYDEIDEEKDRFVEKFGSTGTLIHKDAIKTCGVYNGDIFYVGLEDVDYSLRIKEKKFRILYSANACYYHPDLNVKYSIPLKKRSRFIEKLAPFNMSYVSSSDLEKGNQRAISLCRGSAYINERYCKPFSKKYNKFFSLVRLLAQKAKNRNVKIRHTLKYYKEGEKIAKQNRGGHL